MGCRERACSQAQSPRFRPADILEQQRIAPAEKNRMLAARVLGRT
jgi:hypothetical protein